MAFNLIYDRKAADETLRLSPFFYKNGIVFSVARDAAGRLYPFTRIHDAGDEVFAYAGGETCMASLSAAPEIVAQFRVNAYACDHRDKEAVKAAAALDTAVRLTGEFGQGRHLGCAVPVPGK